MANDKDVWIFYKSLKWWECFETFYDFFVKKWLKSDRISHLCQFLLLFISLFWKIKWKFDKKCWALWDAHWEIEFHSLKKYRFHTPRTISSMMMKAKDKAKSFCIQHDPFFPLSSLSSYSHFYVPSIHLTHSLFFFFFSLGRFSFNNDSFNTCCRDYNIIIAIKPKCAFNH